MKNNQKTTKSLVVNMYNMVESFVNDDVITSSCLMMSSLHHLADVLHGCVRVAVADVNAASGRGTQSSLTVSREALLKQCRLFINLYTWKNMCIAN